MRAHGAGQRVDQRQRALGVKAGIAGGEDVGPDHVDGKAMARAGEQHVPDEGRDEEQDHRHRNARECSRGRCR